MSINFSDDAVAQKFFEMADNVSSIKTKLEELPEIKKKVEKHERAYNIGKVATVPALGLFHVAFRHVLNKLGF